MSDQNAAKLSSIKTYLLVALIFNVLAILLFLVLSLAIFPLLWLILSIIVLATRVWPMRDAAEKGDIAKLRSLNSVGWGVIALIFAGVITGIFLLLANGPVNELVASPTAIGGYMPAAGAAIQQGASSTRQMADFKYCSSCGTRMDKSAAFCPKCGAAQK